MSEQDVFDALRYRIEVDSYGHRFYYNKAGEWHRENGPAIISARGDKYWYQYNRLHRTDGPAVVYANGTKYWWQNGLLHRTDGPAVTTAGYKRWYINGTNMTEAEFKEAVKHNV